MARISAKVKGWTPSKGAVKGTMDIYYAIESNKDTLFDIYVQHKAWGSAWYELVRRGSYINAKMILAVHGNGHSLVIALNCIDDIIALETEMKGDIQ